MYPVISKNARWKRQTSIVYSQESVAQYNEWSVGLWGKTIIYQILITHVMRRLVFDYIVYITKI